MFRDGKDMTTSQNTKNPFDTYHLTPVSYDKNGIPYADAPFTSKKDTKRQAVIVPPSKVIPVILIPGIMGSNLRLKKLPDGFADKRYTTGVKSGWEWPPVQTTTEGWGDRAWRPDDGVSFMARRFWPLDAYERRRLLDPYNTVVDDRAEIPKEVLEQFVFESSADGRDSANVGEQRKRGFTTEMARRGWGTVMLSSYGPLLAYLERNLNQMYRAGELNEFWRQTILNRQPGNWRIIRGDKPLTEESVKKAASYWLPVHAIGYNWTQSNADSAAYVAQKITSFMEHYQKLGYECGKVLLITHSMGGLVARAVVHPDMGKLVTYTNMCGVNDKVLGVIHGVMPTHGAAAAYRRCRAGFEGAGVSVDSVAADILGRDGKEVAAVFSNSPGALQLLPSKRYGNQWLKIQDGGGKDLLKLPKADPYAEIYREKDAWWRLMNPEWLNPAPGVTADGRSDAWDRYEKNLAKAESFHDTLAATLHPHTHIQYGSDDEDHLAFGDVVWKPSSAPSGLVGDAPSSKQFTDHASGVVHLRDVWGRNGRSQSPARFALGDKEEAGDGTVPRRSAAALNDSAELVAEHAGYEHQKSYQDARAQALVAYGVVRLIAENMP
jgi:hypothetical protein